MMTMKLKNYNVPILVLITLSTVIMGLYLSFDFYLKNISLEFMESWLKTEQVNIKEGSYLPAISKNQRFIFSSQFVKTVALFENYHNTSTANIVAIFGENFEFQKVNFNKIPGRIHLVNNGILRYITLYRFPERPDLVIAFNIAPIIARYIFLTISIFLIAVYLIFYILLKYLNRNETNHRLELIKTAIKDLILTKRPSQLLIQEIPNLANTWSEMVKLTEDFKEKEKIYFSQMQLGEFATQVAHDIRSPLACLKMSTREISHLAEDKRVIIRSSVNRIEDIANSLLEKFRSNNSSANMVSNFDNSSEKASVQLISIILESIITEKRIQLRGKLGIELEFISDHNSYGLFSKVYPPSFKRVVSNLINNSIEALGDTGKVEVSLAYQENKVQIAIKDNGKGIPAEVIPTLFKRGNSFGKENGNGLGLYHAKNIIASLDGEISIDSNIGEGTTIKISLNKETAPKWFVPCLHINKGDNIVIIDDDYTIHKIWDELFLKYNIAENDIKVIHFSETHAFLKWFNNNSNTNNIYLFDYEFLGSTITGIDIIEQKNISSQSILVTSRFEEDKIRKKCEKLKIGVIPKTMVEFIPFKVSQEITYYDAVYIDDDEFLRWGWKKSAYENGIRLLTLDTLKSLDQYSPTLSKDIPFYIDSNLGENDLKGEEWAKILFEKGYSNLYLATGYDSSYFPEISYIKGIIGKDPVWETNNYSLEKN